MTSGIAYVPPNAGDVPALMRQFGLWLRQDHDSADAPLVAGIAHLRLVELHPFWDGNGRTARALEALVLARHGFDFNRLLSPERQFVWELRRYFERIGGTVGHQYEDRRDLTEWLEYFLLSLQVEIRTVSDWLVDFRRFMESFRHGTEPLGLTSRQTDVLAYVHIHGSIRTREYERVFGMSGETARRDIAALVRLGAIRPVGQTRARRYVYDPSERFLELVGGSEEPAERPRPPA